jgi:hypothetical protein
VPKFADSAEALAHLQTLLQRCQAEPDMQTLRQVGAMATALPPAAWQAELPQVRRLACLSVLLALRFAARLCTQFCRNAAAVSPQVLAALSGVLRGAALGEAAADLGGPAAAADAALLREAALAAIRDAAAAQPAASDALLEAMLATVLRCAGDVSREVRVDRNLGHCWRRRRPPCGAVAMQVRVDRSIWRSRGSIRSRRCCCAALDSNALPL